MDRGVPNGSQFEAGNDGSVWNNDGRLQMPCGDGQRQNRVGDRRRIAAELVAFCVRGPGAAANPTRAVRSLEAY
jgi:hypothetical protein